MESALMMEDIKTGSVTTEPEKRFISRHLDVKARKQNLYGVQILRCNRGRRIEIAEGEGSEWVLDFATNGPFGLNLRPEVVERTLRFVREFGTLHTSIAVGRAQTGISREIIRRLEEMKGPDSSARIYPTTFAANCATAGGIGGMNCTVVMHPNVHATVQFALRGALTPDHIIKTKNTAEVATTYALGSRRKVVVVEDGLYSMGRFADFAELSRFVAKCPNGMVWFDDAHSVGMRGRDGRGEAMEKMSAYSDQTIITGSFGKAFGAAGGFLAAPSAFVRATLEVSVSDRFSCNLDVAAQGSILAAMELLADRDVYTSLQTNLNSRLQYVDDTLSRNGILTEQLRTPIAFRVVSFPTPDLAIEAAGVLLKKHRILSTPVYYPTVAYGTGAIRFAISADHSQADVAKLTDSLIPLVRGAERK
jgi:7-keto-8-aminopelargonate synthetase-like enzyme